MQQTQHDNSIAAEQLINAHDGDVALLYIFSRHTGCFDLEQAARALCRTLQELRAAEEKLRRMGLWSPETSSLDVDTSSAQKETPQYLPPADDELPSYTAQEITRLAEQSSAFEGICQEAAKVKGRQLTSHELGVLAGIYDHLRLSPEVIMVLLNYCLETTETRHPGNRPSFRMIQAEAFRWANLELLTLEQVDEYICRERDRNSAVGRIQALLGLSGRNLTAPERKNILSWLDMGFDDGAIQLAYERTVYNTNSLKWSYMNKILQRWHEAGLHNRQEIEEKDSRRSPSARVNTVPVPVQPVDLDELQKILNRI